MSAGLPTRDEMLRNALADLERANSALSDARDWLNSDWTPVGAALTKSQSDARQAARKAIAAAKRDIVPGIDALYGGLRAGAL